MVLNKVLEGISRRQKLQKGKKGLVFGHRIVMMLSVVVLGFSLIGSVIVSADNYDAKIQKLRSENSKREGRHSTLLNEAASFQDKINGLRTQIKLLENQISNDRAESKRLKAKIAVHEKDLAAEKHVLGQNVRKMYTEGDISTLEMLASSKDLGEFVDKEQYRNSLNGKIKETLDKINALKKSLTNKRDRLAKTIKDKKKRQGTLDGQRAEVAKLLAMNSKQRGALESQIASNNSQISKLRAEQARQNAALFGGGTLNVPDTSGYPWAGYNPFPNSVADPWGMYLRQCVSYTAWKVWKSGRHMPFWGGRGNANNWDDNARAAGIPVHSTPHRGDVGVSNAGYYGHVVYVEHVYGNGNILISQYNAGWDGRYSEAVVHQSKFVYVHF